MPAYDYRCLACEKSWTLYADVVERDNQYCTNCGGVLKRNFSTPFVYSPTSGRKYS